MSNRLFHVKICGVTTADDARMIADSGADAVGLNFYPGSPRFIEDATAEKIVAALPSEVCRVGVFVNEPIESIARRIRRLGLNAVQLHGDEPPELLDEIEGLSVIKAFRVDDSVEPIDKFVRLAQQRTRSLAMVLVDSRHPGQYGGTGKAANWDLLANRGGNPPWPPLVLAGGLTTENVIEAIRRVRPTAVDTASGVESSPGHKDPVQVQAFVRAAHTALRDNV